jgi:twitching motility protein PilU
MAHEELQSLLRKMADTNASDLFLTTGAPPHLKVNGESWPLSLPVLAPDHAGVLAYSVMTAGQIGDFERALECNFSYTAPGIGRFRISVYRQRGQTAMVARRINASIPAFDELGLPPVLSELALLRRGLLAGRGFRRFGQDHHPGVDDRLPGTPQPGPYPDRGRPDRVPVQP